MIKEIVSFEIAKEAKEMGFDGLEIFKSLKNEDRENN